MAHVLFSDACGPWRVDTAGSGVKSRRLQRLPPSRHFVARILLGTSSRARGTVRTHTLTHTPPCDARG